MSARQLSRLLDPTDDYMLLVVGDVHRLFDSPQLPPQVRILISPPAAVTTSSSAAAAAGAWAGAGGGSRAEGDVAAPVGLKSIANHNSDDLIPGSHPTTHNNRRGAASTTAATVTAITTMTTFEAEVIVDKVLTHGISSGGGGGGSSTSGGGGGGGGDGVGIVPKHILEYVAASGFQNIRRHWQFNKKRLVRLMVSNPSGMRYESSLLRTSA